MVDFSAAGCTEAGVIENDALVGDMNYLQG
jgi:hypothetical protein